MRRRIPPPEEAVLPMHEHLKKPTPRLSTGFWIDFLICAILAVATHSKASYDIAEPRSMVYDEVHFTKYSTYYITGHFFVDIHPPLAKLIMCAVEKWNGYQDLGEMNVRWWTESGYVGTHDYQKLYADEKLTYLAVRRVSAVVGTVLVVSLYLASRALGCSRPAALFTASLGFFDNMIAVYSRLILTDIYLWTFHIAAIGASFASVNPTLGRHSQVAWTIMTGLLLGCTLSVKYLAGGTVGLVGIHQLAYLLHSHGGCFRQRSEKHMNFSLRDFVWTATWRASTILGLSFVVFMSCWAIHINMLPYKGGGDGFVDQTYQYVLIPKLSESDKLISAAGGCPNKPNAHWDCGWWNITARECEAKGCCWDTNSGANWCYPTSAPKLTDLSMWTKIMLNLRGTWRNNQGEGLMYHPTMSRWWQWPFLTCRLVVMSGRGRGGMIYSIGNPVGWALVGVTVLLSVVGLVLDGVRSLLVRRPQAPAKPGEHLPARIILLILIFGYLGCLLPFHFIKRSTWNYHYALALVVGFLLCGFYVDLLLRSTWINKRLAIFVVLLLEIMVIAGFCYWAPWTYGFELSQEAHRARKWHALWTTTGSAASYGMANI
eukprot:gb/GEZN01004051.1/.p1 GENE.gb/GEZN01004051.1/~~gb/GEZN01004051.1/.p1  ORF type:complete len:601 (+),score=34.30 gb/GEZN01004051.1/:22-1824(+)